MSNGVFVARVEDLSLGECLVVQVGEKPVAVFHTAGGYRAVVDFCSHRAGPLSEGKLEGEIVTCPWHGSQFDLTTGKPVCRPAVQPLATYLVSVENGEIRVFPKG